MRLVLSAVLLHGFGPPYTLPVSLALYLYGAGAAVLVSFVAVAILAADRVGSRAVAYSRRPLPFLVPIANSPWPRRAGGALGFLGLVTIIVTGLLGAADPNRNPSEYVTWILFWVATLVGSGLVGNLYHLLNPFAAIYDAAAAFVRVRPRWRLPGTGAWPAVAMLFAFSCLELTSGMANRPYVVGGAALVYTVVTLAGMLLFGRDEWLGRCEVFSVLFAIIGQFGPLETEHDAAGRVSAVYLRPWGVGLLNTTAIGWDRTMFVVLMLSTLTFDALIATPTWQDFTIVLEPVWLPLGAFGYFLVRTAGMVLVTICFLLVLVTFIDLVMYFGVRRVDRAATLSTFAFTLVPIVLAYDAAHNYYYLTVQAQRLIPLLDDPLAKGWHLWPAVTSFTPNLALAQPAIVWYAQVVLIVLGAVVTVYLSYLRAGERFRRAQRVLISQYPMLLLIVVFTMASLWILAQPVTRQA